MKSVLSLFWILTVIVVGSLVDTRAMAAERISVDAIRVPFGSDSPRQIVLSNDSFRGHASQSFLQSGFEMGEMAGVWVSVPTNMALYKVEAIRVLVAEPLVGPRLSRYPVEFRLQVSRTRPQRPEVVANVSGIARVIPGWHWNDIPLSAAGVPCVAAGGSIGVAIGVTRQGPSGFYRDSGMSAHQQSNVVMLRPGGWQWASALGVRGNWIMRVTGRTVESSECDSVIH